MEIVAIDEGWVEAEFEGISLGDPRLEKRVLVIAEKLSAKPQAPIHYASEDWKNAKAAYRFFDNEKVSSQKILEPHQQHTVQRVLQEPIILAIQDTTYLNFNHGIGAKGLGPIGEKVKDAHGLIMHTTLAVTPTALPLGILNQKIWAREGYKDVSAKERYLAPIEEKESYRWIEALRQTKSAVPQSTRIITVCDREGDIFEFLQEANALKSEVLVRASVDRRILSQKKQYFWKFLEKQPTAAIIEVELPQIGKKSRKATLEIRVAKVTFRPPKKKSTKKLKPLILYGILAREKCNRKTKNQVEWMLLTNIPTISFDDAAQRIAWYRCRWQIEVFHKILKSGCEVERCLLKTSTRLERYLTLFSIIAWRLFWLTHISRVSPRAPAKTVVTQLELETLQAYTLRSPTFKYNLTTAKEVVLAIAIMGGYLHRKNDPTPGPLVLWRGWQRLQDMTIIYQSPIGKTNLNGATYG